jgi:hypothetical protein
MRSQAESGREAKRSPVEDDSGESPTRSVAEGLVRNADELMIAFAPTGLFATRQAGWLVG